MHYEDYAERHSRRFVELGMIDSGGLDYFSF